GLSARLASLYEVVGEQDVSREKQFAILAGKILTGFIADGIRSLNCIPGEMFVSAASETEFVQDSRSHCRNERCRKEPGISPYQPVIAVRPIRNACLRRHRPVFFPCSTKGGFMLRIEIVVNPDIVLIAIRVLPVSD